VRWSSDAARRPGNPVPIGGRPADRAAALTSFVGRAAEVTELTELLGARRLVTLTGVGGAGKTRLALEVAARVAGRHRDGVRLIELAGLRDGALVPEAVLAALDMRQPEARRTPTEVLCAALGHRDLLLVVDNCEHSPTAPASRSSRASSPMPSAATTSVAPSTRARSARRSSQSSPARHAASATPPTPSARASR
jgi:hypothetical protein